MRTSTMSSPISSSLGRTARNPEQRQRETSAMARLPTLLRFYGLLAVLIFAAVPHARADDLNDYPTVVRADYVFGCMKANGETRQALERCSCSIDVIASILPYERYVTAETVLRMAQVPGTLGSQFRSTESAKVAVDDLRRAQARSEERR